VVTRAAEGPVVVEVALAAPFDNRNDVVGVPDAFPASMTVPMDRNVELGESGYQGLILQDVAFVVEAPLVLERSVLQVGVERFELPNQEFGRDAADRAHASITLPEQMPHEGWLGSDLPRLNTGIGTEGLSADRNLALARTTKSPSLLPFWKGAHGAKASSGINPECRHWVLLPW
jgi:hypothetical protein